MSLSNIRIESLLMLLFLSLTMCSAGIFSKVHVKITNDLGVGLVLNLHCKSRDDDFGTHVLPLHDSFQFSFRPNVIWTTIFACSFQWKGGYHVLDIYNHNKDSCTNCTWSIVPSGPCKYNFDAKVYDCYTWPAG